MGGGVLRSPVRLAPDFEFPPIDSSQGQIRLLKIAPGKAGEPIRCVYEISSVDGNVPYETLSYIWGRGDRTKPVVVQGTEAQLTDNLFAALSRIRHETQIRFLWVDALCINQDDSTEKMAQVNMMHKIYSKCVQCNLWMGEISSAALGLAEPEALDAAKGALDAVRILAGQDFENRPPQLSTADQHVQAGRALKALMHVEWWGRIWTVQEATSPKSSTVVWGPLSIPWEVMRKAADNLVEGVYPPEERLSIWDFFDQGISAWFTAPLIGLEIATGWIEEPHPPLEMLWRFRYRDSTDPRDKVYVILNLVAEGTNPLPSVPSSDYTINPAILYRRVMLDLFRDEWGLRAMIGLRGERKSIPGLPSWVVDWSLPPGELAMASYWEHSNFWPSFTADKGLPMLDLDQLTLPEYGEDVLNVNGVFFDKVLVCSDLMAKDGGRDRLYEMVTEVITEALAKEPRHHFISEVYWRHTLTDIIDGKHVDPRDEYEGQTGDEYWRETMLKHQRLFITENGAVGLGPSGTSVGDEVWILAGGRSPFLLGPLNVSDDRIKDRDASFHYTFRGDVFVSGIMEGEATESRVEKQRFVHIH
ncbi:HET-domain-containing protein [Nemania abortiva]|nr:HET-domain-containing protein [Nemania abortiva]